MNENHKKIIQRVIEILETKKSNSQELEIAQWLLKKVIDVNINGGENE